MDVTEPFDRVVAAHGGTVLRVCRAVLGAHPDAEDAWSETFLAALSAWPELTAGSDVRAWLVTIAHRKAIDVVRARQRRAVTVAEVPDRPSTLGRPGARDHDLWAALATLPDGQRRAVAYHHLGGLPHDEVARLVGVTPAAARQAASTGIRRLRVLLADHEGDTR